MLLHTIGAPATELDIEVKATDEERRRIFSQICLVRARALPGGYFTLPNHILWGATVATPLIALLSLSLPLSLHPSIQAFILRLGNVVGGGRALYEQTGLNATAGKRHRSRSINDLTLPYLTLP